MALITLFDSIKASQYFISGKLDNLKYRHLRKIFVINEIKLYLSPLSGLALANITRELNSSPRILSHIYKSNYLELTNTYIINKFLNEIFYTDRIRSESLITTRSFNFNVLSIRESHLITNILMRCKDLVGCDLLTKSFTESKNLKLPNHAKHQLFAGIIHFMFILCFEAFSPGLNDFLKLSIEDIEEIIDLNPYLTAWNAEVRLLKIVSALYNRSDRHAIDAILQFLLFETSQLNSEFLSIAKYSLNIDEHTSEFNQKLIEKIVHKFGNQNLWKEIVSLKRIFIQSENLNHGTLKADHLEKLCSLSDYI